APEERWWLFTMTNAATGHAITGRGKGWRRAVRFALTENPVAVGHAVDDSPLYRPRERFGLFEALEPQSEFQPGRRTADQEDDSRTLWLDGRGVIETQFPVSRLCKESYKERKANHGQTLTGLGKWWGRKPLVLVRAAILGLLLPVTEDPQKDRE